MNKTYTCATCNTNFVLDARGRKPKDGKRYCIDHASPRLRWSRNNQDIKNAWYRRFICGNGGYAAEAQRKMRYGEDAVAYSKTHDGLCDFCGDALEQVTPWDTHWDHDHNTGLFRGIVHARCNRRLGVLDRYRENGIRYIDDDLVQYEVYISMYSKFGRWLTIGWHSQNTEVKPSLSLSVA